MRSNLGTRMSPNISTENILNPTTLQEAINIIKFLSTSHKQEIAKLKDSYQKQAEVIKKLESNRKKELEFLSSELQKYEVNLALRTDAVTKQLAQKDDIIQKQAEIIEELNRKLEIQQGFSVPEVIVAPIDSNSDSGIALESEDTKVEETKTESKNVRKCSRRFADSISFLRRVDFSPMKYKPSNRDSGNLKKKEDKKSTLEVPIDKRVLCRQHSDEERPVSTEPCLSDGTMEPIVIRPKKMNDSMTNHFSDDGSEDTSEEIFDRVMTRSSVRRSVKANPKYKKINRTKSKLLEQVKINIID